MAKKKDVAEAKPLLGRPKNTVKMGLVGLPNVGKSTTFNVLSKQSVPAENYPFCTIDPHEAKMSVPDDRFTWLCEHFKPKSQVAAALSVYDIAGLVPGAHEGAGLGNAFLSHIAAADGIYHVVRAFDDPDVIQTEGSVDPIRDLGIISNELIEKDKQRIRKELEDLNKSKAQNQSKQQLAAKVAQGEMLDRIMALLNTGKWVSGCDWKASEIDILNEYQFLTAKPVVYLVNLSIKDFVRQKNKWLKGISEWVGKNIPGAVIPFSADFESQLLQLPTEVERNVYVQNLCAKYAAASQINGATPVSATPKTMLSKIINSGYSALHLIHFFTCGEDEVKCWTIRENVKAPQAAGVIHTDFEKGFICAEVYNFIDIKDAGSEQAVKLGGKYLQKGKDYVVQDADVIFFKFNVTTQGKK